MSTSKKILNEITIRERSDNNENKQNIGTDKHLKQDIHNITQTFSTMNINNKENSKTSFEKRDKFTLSPNKKMMSKRVNLKLNKSEVTTFPKDSKAKIKYTF